MLQLLLFLLLLPASHADCPAGSVPSVPPSKCFYFMTTPASYTGAYESCKNKSADLVSLHDRFTDSFLGDKSGTIFNGGATDFWIGATGTSFAAWLWSDGSPTDYQDWGNFNPSGTCGSKRIIDGYWNLVDCSQTKPYVCQIDETDTTTPPSVLTTTTKQPNCAPEWFYFEETNSCYYWTDTYTWSAAEDFCVQNNAHLASIHSFNELNFTKTIYNGALWIGLRSADGTVAWNTNWHWSDGSVLDYSLWSGDGMPFTGSSKNCAYASYNSFVNDDCTYSKYGLCKKPSANSLPTVTPTSPSHAACSDGWTYFELTNSCYLFKTTNTTTWQQAEEYCVDQSSHLASIHSEDESNFVQAFAPYYPWIGLKTKSSPVEWNTTWFWSDNTVFDYEQWGYWNIPSLDDKLCVYLSFDGFRNADCTSGTSYAVCKKPSNNINPTSPVSSTTTSTLICPPGWDYYVPTNSCYFVSSQALYNWTSAEEFCAFNGGHLASVHSYGENDFVYHSYDAWIGLYTKDDSIVWNSTWYWTDETKVDYLPWSGGIPSFNGLRCVTKSGYYFLNSACSKLQFALCKKPSNNINPTSVPATPTPTAPAQNCPTSWDYNSKTNSCYIRTSGVYNWTTTLQYCASYDSQLVSIHNLDEYNFLQKYTTYNSYYWIGLYSDTNAITWKWTDGSAFDYPYWSYGYPVRGGPICGSIYYSKSGFTNAPSCGTSYYGICKKPALQN